MKRELEIVAAIAEALNSAPTVQIALERTLEVIARELKLDTGWVWLVDAETGHIYSAAARNLPPYLQEPVRMTGSSCWCIEQFRDGELEPRNVDVMGCSRLRPAMGRDDLTRNIAHHASVPLTFQGKPLGILNITAPELRRLSARELRLLSTIGFQLGVAIERARLAEESAAHARADERTRLAREIHDTIAQSLTAIALQIEAGRSDAALRVTRETLEEARRSVMNLRLAEKPLAQALALLVREFTSQSGIRVSLDVARASARECELPVSVEAELYRIAQQALANVSAHARAKHVRVSLRCTAKAVTLTIEDDGVGFDLRRIPEDRHGIRGMRERARLAGGTLKIATGRRAEARPTLSALDVGRASARLPVAGTKIIVRVPR
ncbi:MAG TPA: GAF domain-containing sensor histidine kinase [Thermoanaerobaculia bacterium]|nr:GAF domain-containing sensor histidine kinase [Thermoanaerobaculia bacterium]